MTPRITFAAPTDDNQTEVWRVNTDFTAAKPDWAHFAALRAGGARAVCGLSRLHRGRLPRPSLRAGGVHPRAGADARGFTRIDRFRHLSGAWMVVYRVYLGTNGVQMEENRKKRLTSG